MYSKEFFSRALKVKRAERDWTQDDLAKHAGLSGATIANYETGRTIPTFEAVCEIADACNCSIEDFREHDACV